MVFWHLAPDFWVLFLTPFALPFLWTLDIGLWTAPKTPLALRTAPNTLGTRRCLPYTLAMIINRLVGGCLAAASFILFGLVMSSRGSSTLGIGVMDRLGLLFVLLFLAGQVVACVVFIRRKDLLVPLLLFAGGTVLFGVMSGTDGSATEAVRVPLYHALMAGASFSGLASGALVMMGNVPAGTGK